MTTREITLPPLPRQWQGSHVGLQMQAFARQAVELDRQSRAACAVCGLEIGASCSVCGDRSAP